MATITKYHTFSDGYIPAALITAARLNTNWDRLYTLVNGALDNDNMASGYRLVVTSATKPTWTSSYTGIIVYCTDTGKLWFGDSSAFQEITPSHAMLSSSHSDSTAGAVSAGQIIYANSTPKWTALAGDNTGTKKFLSMTSLVPSWAAILETDLPAVKIDNWATPDDNTDLNVSTSAHGLCPKLSNDGNEYLNGVGGWTNPAVCQTSSDATPSVTISNDTEKIDVGVLYHETKTIKINEAFVGSILVTWSYASNNAPTEMYSRVYKNGVSNGGTEFNSSSETYSTDGADTITGPFAQDDLIQIFTHGPSKIQNMRIKYTWQLLSVSGYTLATPLDITATTAISTTNQDPA